MKYYHKCITGHGTELWAYTHTWFGAAMAAFGAQGATFVKTDKDKTKVEYTGGWITRQSITERADQTAVLLFDGVRTKPPIVAVEVEGFTIDDNGDLVLESDLDPGTHIEDSYTRVRYAVFLTFQSAGRDDVADFVLRKDAETAQEELETYFGVEGT